MSKIRYQAMAIVSVLPIFAGVVHAENARPNVLMICIDDLNDWVGFLGVIHKP